MSKADIDEDVERFAKSYVEQFPGTGFCFWDVALRPIVEHYDFVCEGYEQELRPLCAAARKVLTAFNEQDPGDVKPSTYTAFLNVLAEKPALTQSDALAWVNRLFDEAPAGTETMVPHLAAALVQAARGGYPTKEQP